MYEGTDNIVFINSQSKQFFDINDKIEQSNSIFFKALKLLSNITDCIEEQNKLTIPNHLLYQKDDLGEPLVNLQAIKIKDNITYQPLLIKDKDANIQLLKTVWSFYRVAKIIFYLPREGI